MQYLHLLLFPAAFLYFLAATHDYNKKQQIVAFISSFITALVVLFILFFFVTPEKRIGSAFIEVLALFSLVFWILPYSLVTIAAFGFTDWKPDFWREYSVSILFGIWSVVFPYAVWIQFPVAHIVTHLLFPLAGISFLFFLDYMHHEMKDDYWSIRVFCINVLIPFLYLIGIAIVQTCWFLKINTVIAVLIAALFPLAVLFFRLQKSFTRLR